MIAKELIKCWSVTLWILGIFLNYAGIHIDGKAGDKFFGVAVDGGIWTPTMEEWYGDRANWWGFEYLYVFLCLFVLTMALIQVGKLLRLERKAIHRLKKLGNTVTDIKTFKDAITDVEFKKQLDWFLEQTNITELEQIKPKTEKRLLMALVGTFYKQFMNAALTTLVGLMMQPFCWSPQTAKVIGTTVIYFAMPSSPFGISVTKNYKGCVLTHLVIVMLQLVLTPVVLVFWIVATRMLFPY